MQKSDDGRNFNTAEEASPYIYDNTLAFASHTAQAFHDMTGAAFEVDKSSFAVAAHHLPSMIHAVIPFYGMVQGTYIISLEEKTAGMLTGVYEEGSPPAGLEQYHRDFGDFIVEVLNVSAARGIESLPKSFEEPTMLPGHIIFGETQYPDIQGGKIELNSDAGRVVCRFLLNLMNLKVVEDLRYYREVISSKNKEIRQSRENLDQVMSTLPELNKTVDELFFAQNRIYQNLSIRAGSDSAAGAQFKQLNLASTRLRNILMDLWAVPLKQTFSRTERILEQLSGEFGKPVRFTASGGEAEINRQLEDLLVKALGYLIHNTVKHGIENAEKRLASGKGKRTAVRVKGYTRGRSLIIEYEDDGKGLNRKKIRDMAVRRKIIPPEKTLSDEEADQLLFSKTLFSTQGETGGLCRLKKITDLLKGRVDVRSAPGEGTAFILYIPLAMTVAEGILAVADARQYVIPIRFIREIFSPEKEACFTVEGRDEMIRLRNRVMPVIRISDLAGDSRSRKDVWKSLGIVVENGDACACLLVDEVIEMHNAVVRELGEGGWLTPPECIAGCTIMADGKVSFVLDVRAVFETKIIP